VAEQVPSTAYDPGTSGTICYFGVPTNVFCGNFVLHHDPVSYPDARSRIYQGIEFDFANYGTVDYEMSIYGISMDYSPVHAGVKATTDSYGMKMSGFPNGLIINYVQGGATIIADGFNVHGFTSPAPWAGSSTYNVITETNGVIDSSQMSLKTWMERDINGTDYTASSFRMAVLVNPIAEFSLSADATMTQLCWNPQAFPFGLTIASGAGAAALSVDQNAFVFVRSLNAANDAAAAAAGVPVGAMYRNGNVLQIRLT
jgi:hypothetical protein